MQILSILDDYGNFFYKIGQSTYKPTATKAANRTHQKSLLHFTYVGLYFTVIAVLTIVGLTLEALRTENVNPLCAFAIVVTACSHLAAILQCKLYPRTLEAIHQLFLQMDHVLDKRLGRTIFYETYRNVFCTKFIILVVAFGIDFAVVMIVNVIYGRELPVSGILLTLMCLSVVSHLHTLFYVGLHVFVYEKFCKIVGDCGGNGSNGSHHCCGDDDDVDDDVDAGKDYGGPVQSQNHRQIIRKFQTFKMVHFNLWMTSYRISEYFGWAIIAFYLQNFLHMTNSAFYIYVFAQGGHEHTSEAGIIRMYCINNKLSFSLPLSLSLSLFLSFTHSSVDFGEHCSSIFVRTEFYIQPRRTAVALFFLSSERVCPCTAVHA